MRQYSIVPHSALSVYRASSVRQCSIVPHSALSMLTGHLP